LGKAGLAKTGKIGQPANMGSNKKWLLKRGVWFKHEEDTVTVIENTESLAE